MIEKRLKGFICDKVDFKESDAIFSLNSEDGLEVFKARGINKITSKNASVCNYFTIGEFILQSKTENSNKTLKTASIIKQYKRPYEDILVSSSYIFICSMLKQLKEVSSYDLAIRCFDYLEEGIYPINVLNYFLKYLCDYLGYSPSLDGCINCNKKTNLISFSLEDGGFICYNCFKEKEHNKLASSFLKEIYSFYKEDSIVELNESSAIKLFSMYVTFIKESTGLIVNKDFIFKCI